MGGGSSSFDKERYMGGKTFQKYFKEDIWPVHDGVFDRLGLTEPRAYKLFSVFARIDFNENGTVDSEECFRFFQAPRTKFTERIFFFERRDPDTNELVKSLNFKEFALLLWSFCTLSPEGIARYVFEVFDVDNAFLLTRAHLETMYRMLYNVAEVEDEYIAVYPLQEPVISRSTSRKRASSGSSSDGGSVRIHGRRINLNYDEDDDDCARQQPAPPQLQPESAPPMPVAPPRHNRRSFLIESEKSFAHGAADRRFGGAPRYVSTRQVGFADVPAAEILALAHQQQLTIDKATFLAVSAKHPKLLIYPALIFQKLLRRKTCGLAVWKLLTVYRQSGMFAVFDRDCDRLDEAHVAIFRAVENQVLESKQLSADLLLQQNSAKLRYDADAVQREKQMREKQEMIERRRHELTGPDVPMKKAWHAYETKKAAFEGEEFIAARTDVLRRKALRDELFQYLDVAIAKSREYFAWKDERDLKLAEGTETDHEQRYADFKEQRADGKQLTELVEITHLLSLVKESIDAKNAANKYYREDQKTEKQVLVETNLAGCVKLFEPILRYDEATVSLAELDKRLGILTRRDLSEEAALASRVGTSKLWAAARLSAHKELVQFVRAKTLRQAREDIAKAKEQRERDWKKAEWYVVCTHGSRITQWEFVLEKETNRPCYVSSLSGERRHPKTAFCEQCDAIMVQHELRCVQCDAPRSAKNLLLYRPLGFKDITLE